MLNLQYNNDYPLANTNFHSKYNRIGKKKVSFFSIAFANNKKNLYFISLLTLNSLRLSISASGSQNSWIETSDLHMDKWTKL